jgi:hypothetical protein
MFRYTCIHVHAGNGFFIVNFPYFCSNIPDSPAYGVYISQLIRYARACSTYNHFLVQGSLLINKLTSQGFQLSRLQAAFRKFHGRYNDLIYRYNLSLDLIFHFIWYWFQWQTDHCTIWQTYDFDFAIVNFPFLCSNIPLSPPYGVHVSQLIRYTRTCFAYEYFSKRGRLLTDKLMLQGYNEFRLKSSFRKFYGRYNYLICYYKLPLAHMLDDLFHTIC